MSIVHNNSSVIKQDEKIRSSLSSRTLPFAPELQASLACNEMKTLAPRKWAFPPLLFMREWRAMRLDRKHGSRATR